MLVREFVQVRSYLLRSESAWLLYVKPLTILRELAAIIGTVVLS
jgi:hypothetical protein